MSSPLEARLAESAEARRASRLSDSRRILSDALREIGIALTGSERAVLLRELGEADRRLGDLGSARKHYEEAVAIYRAEGLEPLRLAHTLRHLGDVHCQAGNQRLGGPCYGEALRTYREHSETPPLELANAIRSMALFQESIDVPERARLLWTEARDLYAAADVAAGVAESERRLAELVG